MIYRIKSSRYFKKCDISDLQMTNSFDEMNMNAEKSIFSRMMFDIINVLFVQNKANKFRKSSILWLKCRKKSDSSLSLYTNGIQQNNNITFQETFEAQQPQ